MVLRSLSVYGFKSFADKLDIEFGEGTTAIIGPNGCGKSNVVDAIRWVFGEQKASALRSTSMQDVIFSGTAKRQPLNMAEVTLVIDNSRHTLPVEYGQVAITRRVFRSGDSEYLINKVPCRLKDIHDLFLDTGIGSSAYTTIENNMINQILSDKTEERRILFDEAAGIGKYKLRRKESQRKLESTSQDLLRINDKVQEADRQVRMLARHVEKAHRYKRYFEDLKALEVGYENRRYRALAAAVAEIKREFAEHSANHEVLKAKISSQESEIERKHLFALEKEDELQAASRNVAEAGEKVNSLDREISVAAERQGSLEEKAARLVQDLESLTAQIEEKGRLKVQIEKSMIERVTKHEECAQRVSGAQDELSAFDKRLDEARQHAESLSADQIECINGIGDSRNALSDLKANLNNGLERAQRYERDIGLLETRVQEYGETIRKCRDQLLSVTDAHERLQQSRETLLSRIRKEEDSYQQLVESEKRCEAQIDSSKAQLKFLAGLDAAFEGYEAGVKALLTQRLPGMMGTVADCINVTDQTMIPLIERVLGSVIQTVVFDSDASLQGGMAFLQNRRAGSARMVSLERLARAAASRRLDPAPDVKSLRSCVTTIDAAQPLADVLLGHLYVAQSVEQAMALSLSATGSQVFASPDGVIAYNDGTVVVGSSGREEAGLLQRKAQIEKLTSDVQRLERELQGLAHDREICIINRDQAKFALVEVDERISRGRQEQQEQETTIRHNEAEIQNLVARLQGLRAEASQTDLRIRELEGRVTERDAELAARQSRLVRLQESAEAAKAAVAELDVQRRALTDHLRNVELEMHGLHNRIGQDKSDIERLGREIESGSARKNLLMGEQHDTAAAREDLKAAVISLREQLESQKGHRVRLEHVKESAREAYNAVLVEIDEIRKGAKAVQADLEQVSNRIHELELERTRDEQEQRRIRERMWEAYEVDLESPPEGLAVVNEEDSAVSENIQVLRERIKRVGQVNMAALEDFETENQRLQELSKQRDDLQNAVNDLQAAIRKLDKEARVQFVETFDKVKQNFSDMFTTLFEGGEASLALEENADPLEAQIFINARPAGKKMRGVQLLSGGERALTAIALLFGLYQVKPSAYCILDELDAPLDDANIARFTRLLKRFAMQTQFIVVTHSKPTMEAADILYGVTQQEKGVSTVVSVKFDDVVAQAA